MKKVSSSKKVIAVIVTYNRKELLKESINALLKQNYSNLKLLIIDNNSTDGTKDYISEELKNENVIYKNIGENLGGAGGFNYGMKLATSMDCDYVWIMDDDCIVHKDSLQELINSAAKLKDNFGFLSSKVLWKDNGICTMNIPKKKFSKWLKDFETNYQEITMASFVSLFVKKDIIITEGLPIKDFFIWTDDWEYTRRLSREYKCYYITSSIVTHKSTSNIGADIASVEGDRLNRFKYMYRNDVVLYRREGIKGYILLYLRLCLHKFRILKSNKTDKKERIKLINEAIKDGKTFYPHIEYVNNGGIKVLECFAEPLSYGGQEAFIYNMYSNFKNNEIKYTFFTPYYCDNTKLKDLIKAKEDNLIVCNNSFDNKLRKYYYLKELKRHLKENNYDIVHIHSGSIMALALGAKICKKNGVKRVIVHSHCTGVEGLKHKIIKKIFRKTFLKNADEYFGCSLGAIKFKFPKEIIERKKYEVIKNGIDLNKFKFNQEQGDKYRKELNIENKYVLLNIGRMTEQKNQLFLIELLNILVNDYNEKDTTLIIVGDGPLLNKIIKKIEEYNLRKNIIIMKSRDDVNNIMSASNIFLFPSIYEGLGIVAIESQASGLLTLCSEYVPSEANVSELYQKISLNKNSEWINAILRNKNSKRKDVIDTIKKSGYNVKECAKSLEKKYNFEM